MKKNIVHESATIYDGAVQTDSSEVAFPNQHYLAGTRELIRKAADLLMQRSTTPDLTRRVLNGEVKQDSSETLLANLDI
jgi:hypothetical protein